MLITIITTIIAIILKMMIVCYYKPVYIVIMS